MIRRNSSCRPQESLFEQTVFAGGIPGGRRVKALAA